MIPTPHIEVKDKLLFAKTVLMPGDPLRAKFIAETYLTDVKAINHVRNMLAFTGNYHGKKVTVMGSGMGMPSIGIYSYELFAFYGVEEIIRIGSCGSYSKDASLYDVIIVRDAYSESSFASVAFGEISPIQMSHPEVLADLEAAARRLGYPTTTGRIHSSDVFYRQNGNVFFDVATPYHCLGVEMESFALFANAKKLGKRAGCILTVSDSLVTHEATTAKERQESFNKMMEIALEAAI
ncbi:MAG: purine-nucleoside phosphorylase [Bacilli bacterium]